jgi:hypothetical protein
MMKPIDKKDRPKLVMLGVLSAGAFGFAVTQFTATPTTNAGTRPAAAKAAAAAASGQPAPDGGTSAPAAADGTSPGVSDIRLVTSGKNPFVPNGPAAVKKVAAAIISESRPDVGTPRDSAAPRHDVSDAGTRGAAALLGSLPGPGSAPGGGVTPPPWLPPAVAAVTGAGSGLVSAAGGASAAMPVAPAPAPPPDYVVTGIVRGDGDDVAILRGGSGDERRFVRAGDPLGNDFVVKAVRADGVEIARGERRIVLKLGEKSRAN